MKILLTAINAKYIHSNLAVYSLRAYAKGFQDHIAIAEYSINHRADYILNEIYKKKPDIICFSCYIWNISLIKELIQELHQLCPNMPIWLGGPEVSFDGKNLLEEFTMIAGIMQGEGEETFRDLCSFYVGGQAAPPTLSSIPGIIYRDGCSLVETVGRDMLSMDEIPFCYEDLTNFKNRIIYYESSRGCLFRCNYCLSSVEKGVRLRSIKLVQEELAFFLTHKVKQVKFIDRTFNSDPITSIAIWKFLQERDNGVTNFHFEISADLLDDNALAFLQTVRPGLFQFEIGVQSTNPATIKEICRSMDFNRLSNAVRMIGQGHNIHQHLDLIAGLPLEGYDSFVRSFDQIYYLHPQQLQLGFLKVLKGSPIYKRQEEYGIAAHIYPPYEVLFTKWLSYDEMLQIKLVEEMLTVYYNSNQFEMTMRIAELWFSSPFAFFLELGKYYEEKGLLAMAHNRIQRCEILLDFIATKDREHLKLYQEALTFDLYLRENMKSRPPWAPEPSTFKKQANTCYPDGKKSSQFHVEPFFHDFSSLFQVQTGYPIYKMEWDYYLFSYTERDPLTGRVKVIKCVPKEP